MSAADPKPRRRWFQFSLRSLLVLVTLFGSCIFYCANWVRERREALQWITVQAEIWREMPVEQGAHLGGAAPWQICLFRKTGVEQISVVVDKNCAPAKQRELERLFPEARVSVLEPGPGFSGRKHSIE